MSYRGQCETSFSNQWLPAVLTYYYSQTSAVLPKNLLASFQHGNTFLFLHFSTNIGYHIRYFLHELCTKENNL